MNLTQNGVVINTDDCYFLIDMATQIAASHKSRYMQRGSSMAIRSASFVYRYIIYSFYDEIASAFMAPSRAARIHPGENNGRKTKPVAITVHREVPFIRHIYIPC